MYYRIAQPDIHGKYQFIGGIHNTDVSVLHWLRIAFSSGRELGSMVVFAGSTVQRLDGELSIFNERKQNVCAMGAVDLLQCGGFSQQEVARREMQMDVERSTLRLLVENLQSRRRLEFARWLYQTGKISEWMGECAGEPEPK